ncbi:ABC transporter ATP-binding protein [Paenibacillus sp. sptzw28]|nr:ABC transporter ATP-binding protein [Paenibacillus sp. sptzw28]
MLIEVDGVSKSYQTGSGQEVEALHHLSFHVKPGEFVCLLGPSGCGKSTLLKLIAGIERADSGTIACGGVQVSGPSTDRGFIFQDYALFPWLTVRQNIAFGLKLKHLSRARLKETVESYLELMGLSGSSSLYPNQLSGGMRQRVALARALCLKPKVLLMDEPFAALDALLRQKLQDELVRLWQADRITFLLVTHDVEEALYLADRIVVMSPHARGNVTTLPVKLPRPRRRASLEFVQLRQHVMHLLESGRAELGRSADAEQPHALALP